MKRIAALTLTALVGLFACGCDMADREGFDPDPGVLPPEPPEEKTEQESPHEEARLFRNDQAITQMDWSAAAPVRSSAVRAADPSGSVPGPGGPDAAPAGA